MELEDSHVGNKTPTEESVMISSFPSVNARRKSVDLLKTLDLKSKEEMRIKGTRKVPQVESVWGCLLNVLRLLSLQYT